jgi:BASS family bile acid:Na+ symporter
MVVMPICVHIVAKALDLSPVLHTALVLLVCAPPLSATANMAALLGLDDALVLNVIVVGTLIVPLSAPVLLSTVLHIPIDLDGEAMFVKLGLLIVLSLGAAIFLRQWIGRRTIEANTDVLDGISALIMVIFAIVVMNGVAVTHSQGTQQLLEVLGVVLLINWGLHGLTCITIMIRRKISHQRFTSQDGAISLMVGNRNMALFIAILPGDTAAALLLFLALYQIPIYLTPILAAPLYGRLMTRNQGRE